MKEKALYGGGWGVNTPLSVTTPAGISCAGITVGNRIPKDYFVTKGKGESNITIHAGSYHLALKAAGIERCNIMVYSSILPGIAQEVEKPANLVHGSVMETIMAVANCKKGEAAAAGITYGWLYDRETGEKYGGLVCECNNAITTPATEKQLKASLEELYYNGFSEQFVLKDINLIMEQVQPTANFGTAIVALCFTNYVFPVLNVEEASYNNRLMF